MTHCGSLGNDTSILGCHTGAYHSYVLQLPLSQLCRRASLPASCYTALVSSVLTVKTASPHSILLRCAGCRPCWPSWKGWSWTTQSLPETLQPERTAPAACCGHGRGRPACQVGRIRAACNLLLFASGCGAGRSRCSSANESGVPLHVELLRLLCVLWMLG